MVRCWISLVLLAVAVPAWADDALWALLSKGGQVVLVRHGLTTPGVGDPPGFKLGECATQRNLVDQGRREAERLGAALRAHNVPVARVLSSPWCRCIETARIALGTDPALDDTLSNLFDHSANREKQVAQFRKLVAKAPAQGNLFLVTHGSTTAAFTGINQGTAEMVIVTPEGGERYRVAGRLAVQ
ncbi:MAG: histidine phosphatase family protein [Casimicrobiaceae bacterium]|jgi:phosphohistidine phosphatase SixA